MIYKKLNCKTCGYEYCPFHGSDREIPAYFCEDYKPADLTKTDCEGLGYMTADLSGVNMSEADRYRANLSVVNTSEADRYRANLSVVKSAPYIPNAHENAHKD